MKKYAFALLISASLTMLLGVTALHVPPHVYEYGRDAILRLEIQEGLETFTGINIRYRAQGNVDYISSPMKPEAPGSIWYTGVIPARHIGDNQIEYYFEFILANQQVETMPVEDGLTKPYTLLPAVMKGKENAGFILLSNDEDFTQDDGYVLAVSYLSIADELDISTIRVWVGGKDVTSKAVITENSLLYRDDKPNRGINKALITAVNRKGDEIRSPVFTSNVIGGKRSRPFEVWGSFNFASNVYDYNHSDTTAVFFNEAKDDYATWLDVYAKYGILNLKSNILVSSFEDSNQQPVNRYSFGLQIPHLELQAGDYSPNLSTLTMSNRNIRGLYGKTHAKFIGLELAAGEMVRMTTIEGVDDGTTFIPNSGTFKQEALGARLRLGLEDGFMLGINATRNRDIISSLDPDFYTYEEIIADSTYTKYSVTPRDNLVLSVDAQLNIPEQNVILGVEIAGSLLNRNTLGGPITSEEIAEYVEGADFINPEDYAELFIINKNMEPLLPSIANLAWNAYFRTYFWNNIFNINYSVTGPAFNALSTYHQQNDTQTISITDQYTLGRVLMLGGGYNVTMDNYSKTYSESNRYNSWFIQSVLRLPHMPYLKAAYFNTDATNRDYSDVPGFVDFVPFKRNTHNLSVGLGYYIKQIPLVPSQLDVTFKTGKDDSFTDADNNGFNDDDLDYENFNNSLNISLSNKLLILPIRTQFVFSIANQKRDLQPQDATINELKNNNYTFFAKADYSLFKSRLIPYAQFRTVNLTGDQQKQSFNYYTFGLEAFPIRDLSISTDISKKYYINQDASNQDHDTLTWKLLLTQRF